MNNYRPWRSSKNGSSIRASPPHTQLSGSSFIFTVIWFSCRSQATSLDGPTTRSNWLASASLLSRCMSGYSPLQLLVEVGSDRITIRASSRSLHVDQPCSGVRRPPPTLAQIPCLAQIAICRKIKCCSRTHGRIQGVRRSIGPAAVGWTCSCASSSSVGSMPHQVHPFKLNMESMYSTRAA